jgi:hypothetical protein
VDPNLDDQFERQFFDYCIDPIVAANAIQQPIQFQIMSDADFEWWWNMVTRTSPLLKLLMKEQATGRDFVGTTATASSAPAQFNGIYVDNWGGQAANSAAFPLAVPYIMPATRVYTILLTDLSGFTNSAQLVFSGFKLWPRPKIGDTSATSGHASSSSGGHGTSGYYGYGY